MTQQNLSDWEQQQTRNARHRAMIRLILKDYPSGLTTQQVIDKEKDYFGYTFLSDNRLRENVKEGYVERVEGKPQRWRLTEK